MIHLMIMCVTVAAIFAAMRYRLTRNRKFDSFDDATGLSGTFPDTEPTEQT